MWSIFPLHWPAASTSKLEEQPLKKQKKVRVQKKPAAAVSMSKEEESEETDENEADDKQEQLAIQRPVEASSSGDDDGDRLEGIGDSGVASSAARLLAAFRCTTSTNKGNGGGSGSGGASSGTSTPAWWDLSLNCAGRLKSGTVEVAVSHENKAGFVVAKFADGHTEKLDVKYDSVFQAKESPKATKVRTKAAMQELTSLKFLKQVTAANGSIVSIKLKQERGTYLGQLFVDNRYASLQVTHKKADQFKELLKILMYVAKQHAASNCTLSKEELVAARDAGLKEPVQ